MHSNKTRLYLVFRSINSSLFRSYMQPLDPQQNPEIVPTTPQSDFLDGRFSKSKIIATLQKGMLLTLPLVIYLFLIYFGIRLLYQLLTPMSTILSGGAEEISWTVHFVSLFLLILIFIGAGYLTKFRSVQELAITIEDNFLVKAPLYVLVRDTVQQFSGLKKMPFSQVVLVDPYGNGVLLTGFVSEEITPDLFTIFVPTAPNPLNGNIYHVPKSNLIFLAVNPEVAMRSIVSMGNGSSALLRFKNNQVVNQILDAYTRNEENIMP